MENWLAKTNYRITNMTGTFRLGNLRRILSNLYKAQQHAKMVRESNWYTYLRKYGINTEYNRRRFHAIIIRVRVNLAKDNKVVNNNNNFMFLNMYNFTCVI